MPAEYKLLNLTLANNSTEQLMISVSLSFPPMPPLPKPQMQSKNLLLKFESLSKCHECVPLFHKTNDNLNMFGSKEKDW